MRKTLERLGWVFAGTCGCDGGGEKFNKAGKDYTIQTYIARNRFSIMKYDRAVRTGHAYEIEKIVTEYELAN